MDEMDEIGKDNGNGNGIRTLELIGSILFGICYIGIVVVIGLFDGVQNSKLWKVSISGIVGLVAMFATINYEFIMVDDSDYEVDIPLIDGTFSFCSLIGSAERILGIYLLKQSLLTYNWVNRGVSIGYTPHIVYRRKSTSGSIQAQRRRTCVDM